jgi:hypothetical protein
MLHTASVDDGITSKKLFIREEYLNNNYEQGLKMNVIFLSERSQRLPGPTDEPRESP